VTLSPPCSDGISGGMDTLFEPLLLSAVIASAPVCAAIAFLVGFGLTAQQPAWLSSKKFQ
jgi:hypothetical protein